MKQLLTAFLLAGMAVSAGAKDFGVQGNIWPIVETDIRQLIVESAGQVDWSKAQDEIKDSAKTYLSRLPKRQLPVADRTATVWFDPSIVLTSDIQAPVKQADGSYAWQVLFPKGTSVNPLAQYRPVTAMFFFDGAQEDQVELVRAVLAKEPNRIVPIEAGAGDLKQTNQRLKRSVFYANDAMLNRFQVKNLPSLVFAGEGAHQLHLGITSFALPFNAEQVLSAWPALRPVNATNAKRPK